MDKKRKQIKELSNIDLKHLENMFVIKQDNDGVYYYDLTDTIYMNPDDLTPTSYQEYKISNGDNFYSLSYRYYNTFQLWWVIAIVNNIDNPFEINNMIGKIIKIPVISVVNQILRVITTN